MYLTGSVLFFGLLLTVHFLNLRRFYTNEFADFDSAIFEPWLMWSYGFIATSLIFIFLNNQIFQNWFKKVFIWFVPIGLLITFSTRVYGGIPQPGRGETASLLSGLLVVVSIIFIIAHLIYDWKKKK
ncbi:MAG: hypothetical protein RLZZ76_138 [Candidatus Parcubacteria bacterium]